MVTGETVNLTRRQDEAFWAWAVIETLRLSGARLEELLEITHLALVSYRLPGSGEVVPLLQIVPSKSNEEHLLDGLRGLAVSPQRQHPGLADKFEYLAPPCIGWAAGS